MTSDRKQWWCFRWTLSRCQTLPSMNVLLSKSINVSICLNFYILSSYCSKIHHDPKSSISESSLMPHKITVSYANFPYIECKKRYSQSKT